MRKRIAAVFSIILALAAVALAGCGQAEEPAETRGMPSVGGASTNMRVTIVDVGKGDCILIQADDSAALVDTGYDATDDGVIAYLRAQGVERLDYIIITHYDKDHVGGLRAIGAAFPVDKVFLPGYEGADKQYKTVKSAVKDLALPAQMVTEEQSLRMGSAELTIFPSSLTYVPDANGDEGNDNDLSLVVTLTSGDDSYLFAGDLEKEGIDAYLKAGHGQFDVLKMPHHGEKSPNTADLLAAVRPQVAIITDGDDDPADKKTLKLLKEAGAEVWRTSADGTIVVESDGTGSYEVTTSR